MGVKTTISRDEILNLLIIYELFFCENIFPALDLGVKVLNIFYLLNHTSAFSRTKIFFSTRESLRRGKKNKGSARDVLQ